MSVLQAIDSFRGKYRFLSNFYETEIFYDGFVYPTVEHAFQAAKTYDVVERLKICVADTPGIAKAMGRKVKLRDDWDEIRINVMASLLFTKFLKPDLRTALLKTYNTELIEGNTWGDQFWGVCDGRGENHLGKTLMKVRTYFQDFLTETSEYLCSGCDRLFKFDGDICYCRNDE